jgi:predicted PurR-regulated permease PerM
MNLSRWIGLLSLIASLYILWQIRNLLLLVFTAVVLATALNKLVQQLQKLPINRPVAVILSIAILLIFLVSFVWLIVPSFAAQLQELVALFPIRVARVQFWFTFWQQRLLGEYENFPTSNNLLQQIQPLLTQIFARSVDVFSASVTAILQFLLVLVLTIMLLANPKPYRESFIQLFPSFYRYRVNEILSRCEFALGNWAVGALIEMVFIALLSGTGLWILQVPLALAHAIVAGVLNFIPNIGPTLSVVLPMAIALLDKPWKVGAVLALYIVIQQIESYWLTPMIMAKQVALLPAITLTAQIIFASLFGVLGLLIALPLTVVAKTWLEEVLFKDVLDKWNQPSAQKLS